MRVRFLQLWVFREPGERAFGRVAVCRLLGLDQRERGEPSDAAVEGRAEAVRGKAS